MAFDFTTIPDPRVNPIGGPAGILADEPSMGYLGLLYDAIQSLAKGAGTPTAASRLRALSAAQAGLASAASAAIGWTIAGGGEQVGTDVAVDGSDATKLDIVNAGIYAVTIKAIATVGAGKLIDEMKLAVTWTGSQDDTVIEGGAETVVVTAEAAPSFTYYLAAGTQLTATLTVISHDASVWGIPATCVALIQRVG